MESFDRAFAIIIIVIISLSCLVKWDQTFPTTIEGKVVQVQYNTTPPYPCTVVTFTTIGSDPTIVTFGGQVSVDTGKTYKIIYATPFSNLFADPIDILLIS